MNPIYKRRFKVAQEKGAGVHCRMRLQLIEWAGWTWGFIRGR
jgi:hypothetical protein